MPCFLLDVVSLPPRLLFVSLIVNRALVFTLVASVVEDQGVEGVKELSLGKLAFADEVNEHASTLEVLPQPNEAQVFVLHVPPACEPHGPSFRGKCT